MLPFLFADPFESLAHLYFELRSTERVVHAAMGVLASRLFELPGRAPLRVYVRSDDGCPGLSGFGWRDDASVAYA